MAIQCQLAELKIVKKFGYTHAYNVCVPRLPHPQLATCTHVKDVDFAVLFL